MNEFIDVTRVNGGKSITINTNSIIYFRPSKLSKSNRTEMMVNGIEKPFIVEECYEDVKAKIYHKDNDSEEESGDSNNDIEETKDNKELNIIIGGRYKSTVGEYLEYNDYFLDYRKLYNDRDYRIAYKNFLKTHIFEISDRYSSEESIGYLHLGTYNDSSDIVMYMTNIYEDIYNIIYYEKSDYMNHDIIGKYLKDLKVSTETLEKVFIKNIYTIHEDYKLNVYLNKDLIM